jgi:hypothetical protein
MSMLTLALVAGSGCDELDRDAKAKCHTLVREFCAALIECGDADESDRADCTAQVAENMQCDDAVQVEDNYLECRSDISRASQQCVGLDDFPSSCDEVIGVID